MSKLGVGWEYELQHVLEPIASVIRVAGSGVGALAFCDLMVLTKSPDVPNYAVECKETRTGKYYPSGDRVQLNTMLNATSQTGVVPVLAVKFVQQKGYTRKFVFRLLTEDNYLEPFKYLFAEDIDPVRWFMQR